MRNDKLKSVGALPPPDSARVGQLLGTSKKILRDVWKPDVDLGIESHLHDRSLNHLHKVRQYRIPKNEDQASKYHEAYKLAWLAVWRARDYSFDGIIKRYSATESNRTKLSNFKFNVGKYTVERFGVIWPEYHAPLFDPNGEYLQNEQTPMQKFATSYVVTSQLYDGVMIDSGYPELEFQVAERSDMCWAYHRKKLLSPAYHYLWNWIETLEFQKSFSSCLHGSTIETSNVVQTNNTFNFDLDLLNRSRFLGDLDLQVYVLLNGNQKSPQACIDGEFGIPTGHLNSELEFENSPGIRSLKMKFHKDCGSLRFSGDFDRIYLQGDAVLDDFGKPIISKKAKLYIADATSDELVIKNAAFDGIYLNKLIISNTLMVSESYFREIDILDCELVPKDFNSGEYDFFDCLVLESAYFNIPVCDGDFSFRESEANDVTFDHCNFSGNVNLFNTSVSDSISFERNSKLEVVVIKGGFDASCSSIKNSAIFESVSFQGAEFRGEANFSNRRFEGRTIFDDAKFFKAPIFHGAKLHQDTSFRGTVFGWQEKLVVRPLWKHMKKIAELERRYIYSEMLANAMKSWPLLLEHRRRRRIFKRNFSRVFNKNRILWPWERVGLRLGGNIYFLRNYFMDSLKVGSRHDEIKQNNLALGDTERAFRTLRQAMEEIRANEQASLFAQHEMRAKHLRYGDRSAPMPVRVIGRLYDITSGYGDSFTRPLLWFLLMWLAMAAFYGLLAQKGSLGVALVTSFTMMIRPLFQFGPAYGREVFNEGSEAVSIESSFDMITYLIDKHELIFKFVSAAHSLSAVILLFLVGVAVKRKFQLS